MAVKFSRRSLGCESCISMYLNLFTKILLQQPIEEKENFVTSCSSRLPSELDPNVLEKIPPKLKEEKKVMVTCCRGRLPRILIELEYKMVNSTALILRRYSSSVDLFSIDLCSPVGPVEPMKLARHSLPKYFYPEFVGSCNGLLCFRTIHYGSGHTNTIKFSLYNPITCSFNSSIPELVTRYANYSHMHKVGFGYDCMSNDYKIFCAVPHKDSGVGRTTRPVESWVYSLNTNSWKSIQPPQHAISGISPRMVLSNNALHWIGGKSNTSTNCIFSFDLGTEDYHEVQQLDNDDDKFTSNSSGWELADLRGELHLVKYTMSEIAHIGIKEYTMQLWVLKKYDSKQSWAKLIDRVSLKHEVEITALKRYDVFDNRRLLENPSIYTPPLPLAYSDDGLEIIICLGSNVECFVRYDLRRGKLEELEIHGSYNSNNGRCTVMPWTGTLVAPLKV